MKLTLVQRAAFVAAWRKLKLTDEDLRQLELRLMERPEGGVVMPGTGGLRKLRFAPPSWHAGKSGAARVCYVHFPAYGYVYLMVLFTKNQKANLTDAERAAVRKLLREIEDELEKGART